MERLYVKGGGGANGDELAVAHVITIKETCYKHGACGSMTQSKLPPCKWLPLWVNLLCGRAYLQALVLTLVLFPWQYVGILVFTCASSHGVLGSRSQLSNITQLWLPSEDKHVAFSRCPLLTLMLRCDVNTAQIQSGGPRQASRDLFCVTQLR